MKMMAKRGLISRHGQSKMNKVKQLVLKRQNEIKKICRAISFMTIDEQIMKLRQILFDLGVANTSDFVLQSLPEDFTYLPDLFC